MKVLDFTKRTDKLVDKLVKLGFHYQSTEMDSEERITTWANVMNGVTLQIIDTYDRYGDKTNVYVKITDDCTNTSVNMLVEEFMELQQITNSHGNTFPRPETFYERITNEN